MLRAITLSTTASVFALLSADVAFAQNEYHLFNPKPADELRLRDGQLGLARRLHLAERKTQPQQLVVEVR